MYFLLSDQFHISLTGFQTLLQIMTVCLVTEQLQYLVRLIFSSPLDAK